MMQIPTGALAIILSDSNAILAACQQHDAASASQSEADAELALALQQLTDVMTRVESDMQSGGDSSSTDITGIGDYALQLHETLSAATSQRQLNDLQPRLASLAINMALWIARHGGRIETLEPVANALALVANSSREPVELGKLSGVMAEIIAAVSSVISQDLEKMNPGRPWRVLLLNYSIVATRSHDTDLMETAFATLSNLLPEEASRFFSEGMEQMDALDYPPQVRRVMEKYHREWPVKRSLH
ncbi:MAG: hypothetical protein WBP44_17155 [Gammaproteobacteria bacterium]